MIPDLLWGTAALALLVFPGWRFAQSRTVPLPAVAGLLIGAVGLLLWILLLQALGMPLSRATVLPLGFLATLASLVSFKLPQPDTAHPASSWRAEWPLLLPLIPAFGVIAYRAIAQPLFGVDTIFRWNFLAEQMLARSSLSFYPPTTAADYAIYGWPDGIAPLVSSLYLWTYLPAGEARPILTAPLVIFQFVVLILVTRELARRLGGERAAGFAGALLAGGPLFLWAVSMGQETGLTALALGGLLLYLPARDQACPTGSVVLAALAAALGALAREYGLVFIAFGFGLCLWRRLPLRATGVFLFVALGATLPWYARTWLHTGNPLFNQSVFGLFPVNVTHLAYMDAIRVEHRMLPAGAMMNLLTTCMLGILGTLAGLWFGLTRARAVLAGLGLGVLLCVTALSFTAAGFTYGLRVLSPALLLSAVLGGAVCARWVPARRNFHVVVFAFCLLATDAALRALVLPSHIYRLPVSGWLTTGDAIHAYHARPVYNQIARLIGEERMIVLGPHALLVKQKARVLPFWSPELHHLWNAAPPAETARRLRDARIRFVLLNQNPLHTRYLELMPFFRKPVSPYLKLIWSDGDLELWHIESP